VPGIFSIYGGIGGNCRITGNLSRLSCALFTSPVSRRSMATLPQGPETQLDATSLAVEAR
jgi:hypothetical protein